MRPLLVILIWVGILGGLWSYTLVRDSRREQVGPARVIQPAPGHYSIRLTPTFDVVGGVNPFGLEMDEQGQLISHSPIEVWLNGREIARHEETAPAGKPIDIQWNTAESPVKVEIQKNEFRIRAFSPTLDPDAVRGLRFELLRDGEPIHDQTIWAPPGQPLDDVLRVFIDEGHMHEAEHH